MLRRVPLAFMVMPEAGAKPQHTSVRPPRRGKPTVSKQIHVATVRRGWFPPVFTCLFPEQPVLANYRFSPESSESTHTEKRRFWITGKTHKWKAWNSPTFHQQQAFSKHLPADASEDALACVALSALTFAGYD